MSVLNLSMELGRSEICENVLFVKIQTIAHTGRIQETKYST